MPCLIPATTFTAFQRPEDPRLSESNSAGACRRDQNVLMDIPGQVSDTESLEALYRAPSERAANKVFAQIDQASARFIDLCPFGLLATADTSGRVDVSPRGGPPGFIQRLDTRHIAIPDLVGNNRLDSHRNIIANGHAGLLLVIPGKEDTLRLNGPAVLSNDPGILAGFTEELRPPKVAIVIRAEEVYAHCAKALRRGQLWQPGSWDDLADAPDLAEIYACQFDEIEAAPMRDLLTEIYRDDLLSD